MATVIKRNKWEIWRDVIFALFVREIRTGFTDKVGISWAVIQPVSFIFILAFLRGRIDGDETHTVPIFTFMAVGLIFIQTVLGSISATSKSIDKNKTLYAFRQVQPISPVISSLLFTALVKVFVILTIIFIMYLLKIEIHIDYALLFLTVFIVLSVLGASIGLLFGIFELMIPEIKKAREMATRPLFFISGVFFSIQDIPKDYWHFFLWNPILHAIELARYSLYESYGNDAVSLNYLCLVTIIIFFISLSCYFSFWKKAINQ